MKFKINQLVWVRFNGRILSGRIRLISGGFVVVNTGRKLLDVPASKVL